MQTYQKKAMPSVRAVPHRRAAATQAPQQDALRGVTDLSQVEQSGRRVDLPAAIQSKMENAFGTDLSGVKLYESQAVADAGADALAQGSHIAFAPGQLDLVSMHGQALLGHELSHVVSQARGEVRGSGLLENHSLESRADREGMMAAMGQSIYPGAAATPGAAAVCASAGMSGPVQARRRRRHKPEPVPYGPENRPSATDRRLGADGIGGDSLGGNLLHVGLEATNKFNNFSSTVEALASQWEDKSYVLGKFGAKAGALNDSTAMGHASALTSSIGTVKNTVDTVKDMKADLTDDNLSVGRKALASAKHLSDWGSDAAGTAKNIVGQFSSVSESVGDKLGAAANGLQIIHGAAKGTEAAIEGYDATSDRLSAERAGRMIAEDEERRAKSGDAEKIKNDKLLRSMATNARGAAKVRKAESVQKGTNAVMDMGIGAVGFIPGVGQLTQLGGSALKSVVNVGLDAHVDQKRKEAREKNLDNLSLRAKLERRLGMRDDLPEKKKNEIRHRAKHIANQITSGERGAKTNKVAGMHKTQGDITALNKLTSQDTPEGVRARGITNAMGIGTNHKGEILDTDAASAQVNADFERGGSVEDQIGAADAHQFEKEHTVQAELKRQHARAEAKAQKQIAKRERKEKKQKALEHFNSLSEENRQKIRDANKRRSAEKDQMIKDQGIKWYEFKKKKAARLEYDINHNVGDKYGGHDVSEKKAQLDSLRAEMAAKANAKEDRAQRKAARKEARAADKVYKKKRDEQRKLAGIKWHEFKKKKEFYNEFDYATGTKERPDANAPEGSATANANQPWYKRAGDYIKNGWYSMRRKHQRARDSFVNEAEDFQKLSGWRKAKLVMQNPLAFAMSKTEKGRAATAKRNAEAAADNQLTEQLMNNPDALDEGEAVPLPKNKAVSPEALQQAKGKLKPLNAPQQPQTSPAPISGQQPGKPAGDPNLPLIQEAKDNLKPIPEQQPREPSADPNLPLIQGAKNNLKSIPEQQPSEPSADPNLPLIQDAKDNLKSVPEQQPNEPATDLNLPLIQNAKDNLKPVTEQQPGESPDDPNLPLIQEAKKKLKKLPAR